MGRQPAGPEKKCGRTESERMEVALVAREAEPIMKWNRQEENGSLQTSVPGVPHLQT